jgi:hypothetical protein
MKQSEVLERVVKFDEVYPRRIGAITEIRSVDRTEDENNPFIVYFFKDSGLEFSKDYILPGETLMITFESGRLQGRDFELAYDESESEFEIINDTSIQDMTIPNELLRPMVGDKYIIYNFDISLVSDQYIPEAERELLDKSTKWLKGITEDNATYTCPNVPGYCYQNGIDLEIGQRVQLVSPVFIDGSKTSRVYGFTKSLYHKYICTYLVGDTSKYSRLAKIDKNINETKKLADVQYRETSKGLRALSYLRTAMENETVIDKGMILTTLLRLGAKAGNEWKEHAGISGIYEEENDPAFWAGGTFEDALENLANIILRMDGSGQLAKGNILWDILGNLTMLGKFESNKDGDRIIIDPEERSLKFINDIGQTLIHMYFEKETVGETTFTLPRIVINHFGAETGDTPHFTMNITGKELSVKDNDTEYEAYIQPDKIAFFNPGDDTVPSFGASRYFDSEISSLYVSMNGLPTSDPDQPGRLFKNGKVLNIS